MGKWEMVRLGDVGQIVTGNTPKTSESSNFDSDDIPFFKPGDFNDGGITPLVEAENYISDNAKDKVRILPANSVLVTCIGIIGKIGITNQNATCNQQINAIIPDDENCCGRYVAYAVMNNRKHLNHIANAAVVPIVNKTQFSNLQIPLPPLSVQQQIADVLDRASALIEKRKTQIEKLDLLVKSQFIEMFGDPVTNPMGWEVDTLGNLGTFKNGMNFSSSDEGYRILCLGVGDFKDLSVIDKVEMLSSINLNVKPSKEYLLSDGDIVFVRSNGNREFIGRSVLIDTGGKDVTFSGFCIRFRKTSNKLNSIFLNAVLHSPSFKSRLLSNGRGANIQNLNQQMLSSQEIILPPMSWQDDFVDFVQRVEAQKSLLQQSLAKLELNYKSLMQKCFQGEVF